jgi:hypothetical protein
VVLNNHKFYENRLKEGRTIIVCLLKATVCVVKSDDTLNRKKRLGTAYDYVLFTKYTIGSPFIELKDKPCKMRGLEKEKLTQDFD